MPYECFLEHKFSVKNKNNYSHLSVDCLECGCAPMYECRIVLASRKDKCVRVIIEARAISRNSEMCVGAPSVVLLDREWAFLLG